VTLKQTLADAASRLAAQNIPSPRMNAELLLMFTLGCDRAYIYAHPERELTGDERSRYEAAQAERARGVPAQYVIGHQEFFGMDFIVTPAVLIPRPETEMVVETVLDILNLKPAAGAASEADAASFRKRGASMRIADVGTGSGCIALALAKQLPSAEIYATDISAAALEIAKANAARNQLETRVQFLEADLLGDLRPGFDIIASNPPYVGESAEDQVQLEVRKFEPRGAVFAGLAGTEVIQRLIPAAYDRLRPGGWLVIEISGTIAEETNHLLRAWDDMRILQDLQGIPRIAMARRPVD
jgi:release factor glutamine methyltransferase